MPADRYLAVHDLWPQQDGSLRTKGRLHITGEWDWSRRDSFHCVGCRSGAGPNAAYCILAGNDALRIQHGHCGRQRQPLKELQVASGARFCYFYTNGHLHAFNGTDAKWFDGIVWRDIGLPTFTAAQLAAINVAEGLSAITPTEASSVGVAVVSGTARRSRYKSKSLCRLLR